MTFNKHAAAVLIAGCIAITALAAPGHAAQLVDKIVAVVNGDIITLRELEISVQAARTSMNLPKSLPEEKERELYRQVLESKIDEILLEEEAERLEIEVSDVEIENQLRQMRKKMGLTQDQFLQQLSEQGLTLADYRDKMAQDILKHRLISAMVRRKVIVTDEEIEAYYQEHMDKYTQERQVELDLIVLPPDADAEAVRQSLVSGQHDFASVARELSVGPGAEAGGRLGVFAWKDMASNWKDALEGVEKGGVSEPFPVEGRTALLRATTVADGQAVGLSEVRDEIFRELQGPKMEALYNEYIQKLRDKAVIDIRL